MITPHYLKDMKVLTIIPEYDKGGQFSSMVIVAEDDTKVRIVPVLILPVPDPHTVIPCLEIQEVKDEASNTA